MTIDQLGQEWFESSGKGESTEMCYLYMNNIVIYTLRAIIILYRLSQLTDLRPELILQTSSTQTQ